MNRPIMVISAAALSACAPPPNSTLPAVMRGDPVFEWAIRQADLQQKLNAIEFRRLIATNPQFRKQVRAELSKRLYIKPNRIEVSKLEQKLGEMPCIGRLSSWDRLYGYGQDQVRGGNDPAIIAFTFRQAGVFGFTDQARIVPSDQLVAIDDRPYKVAVGSYDSRTGRIVMSFCGLNVPAGRRMSTSSRGQPS